MLVLATVEDVELMWRPLADFERPRVQFLVDGASELLRSKVAGLDDKVSSGQLAAILPKLVIVQSILRVLHNPTGTSMLVLGSETASWSGAAAIGRLVFTPDELEPLLVSAPAPGATTIGVQGTAVGTVQLGMPAWLSCQLGGPRTW